MKNTKIGDALANRSMNMGISQMEANMLSNYFFPTSCYSRSKMSNYLYKMSTMINISFSSTYKHNIQVNKILYVT